MSFGIIKRIKKKGYEIDATGNICPSQKLIKSISAAATKNNLPAKSLNSCDWNKKDEYNTITTAYDFDSGLSDCSQKKAAAAGNVTINSPSPSVNEKVPLPKQRRSYDSSRRSPSPPATENELKRNKSLMPSLPTKSIFNPIFKRKSSSSSLNETIDTKAPSLTNSNFSNYSNSMNGSLNTTYYNINHFQPSIEKVKSSNNSLYSIHSANSSFYDQSYKIVVNGGLDF